MAITLPAFPPSTEVDPRFYRAGNDLGGQHGGAIQRVLFLGGRYGLAITLPPLDEAQAREWLAAVLESDTLGDTLVATWPQPAGTALGAPLVNGAGQSGATLVVDGLTPGVTVPKGRFFSFSSGGRHYLHATRDQVVADGGGGATLEIAPKIRKAPADNAALDFVTPKLEGFVQGSEFAWTLERLTWFGIAFALKENK